MNGNQISDSIDNTPETHRSVTKQFALILFLGFTSLAGLFWLKQRTTQTSPLRPVEFAEFVQVVSKQIKDSGRSKAAVVIWATWCEPCREEIPQLAELAKEAKIPLILLSADNLSDQTEAARFLRTSHWMADSFIVSGDNNRFLDQWLKLTENLPSPWSLVLPASFLVELGKSGDFEVTDGRVGPLDKPTITKWQADPTAR